MKNDNVGKYEQCYGCGVCSVVCPTQIIDIKLNNNGFLTPFIADKSQCTNCGLCIKVCSYGKAELHQNNKPLNSFGGWSKDSYWRSLSSSGGIAIEILKKAIQNDYSVCAVEYNVVKGIAQHFITDDINELVKTVGSKYIQSYTLPAFDSFEKNKKYLVVGTPCQIDSLRRYVSLKRLNEMFVFVDFFCHGTPSYFAWEKYLNIVKDKIGSISFINWRNKFTGWHDSWAIGANSYTNCSNGLEKGSFQYYSRLSQGDIFYNLFLGDFCMNPACCDSCKYKYDKSSADIRLGDFWGDTYKNDEKGVSAVVSFTKVGDAIISDLNDTCILNEHDFAQVSEGQMKSNAKPSLFTPVVMYMLRNGNQLNKPILKVLFFFRFLYYLPTRILLKINKMIQ